MVMREDIYYNSRDQKTKIHAVEWCSDTEKPKCVLQIIHGMAEYIECYDYFANYLVAHGFVVVGEDHLGHGKSGTDNGRYGYFCKTDPATVVVRDVHRLKKIMQQKYPNIPYFILGHSMGSFILRNYLFRYGTGIDGALIIGTGNQEAWKTAFGKWLTRFLAAFQGWEHPSGLINAVIFGKNNRHVEHPSTIMSWLTRDTERVEKYMEDKACGFTFTLNGFFALFELISRCQNRKNLEKIPKELPIFIASGDKDPVGNYGKAVEKLYEMYRFLGLNVRLKMYPNARHEILNEINKLDVYKDVEAWLRSLCDEKNN